MVRVLEHMRRRGIWVPPGALNVVHHRVLLSLECLHFSKGSNCIIAEGVSDRCAQFVPDLPRNADTGFIAYRRVLHTVDEGTGPFKYGDNVEDGYPVGRTFQEIAAFPSPLCLYDTAFMERREYVLQILLGNVLSFRDIRKEHGCAALTVYREVYYRP